MALGVARARAAGPCRRRRLGPTSFSGPGCVSEWTAPSSPSVASARGLALARAEAGAPQQPLGLGGAELAAVDGQPHALIVGAVGAGAEPWTEGISGYSAACRRSPRRSAFA